MKETTKPQSNAGAAQTGEVISAIGASVGGPVTVVITPEGSPVIQQVITSSSLIQDVLLPALVTGASVTLEYEAGSNVIRRVAASELGSGQADYYGDYYVSRIATQRKPDGTNEHLEVFLAKIGETTETAYNVFDPILQQLLITAFLAKRVRSPVPEPAPIDVQFDGDDIATVHLGRKF